MPPSRGCLGQGLQARREGRSTRDTPRTLRWPSDLSGSSWGKKEPPGPGGVPCMVETVQFRVRGRAEDLRPGGPGPVGAAGDGGRRAPVPAPFWPLWGGGHGGADTIQLPLCPGFRSGRPGLGAGPRLHLRGRKEGIRSKMPSLCGPRAVCQPRRWGRCPVLTRRTRPPGPRPGGSRRSDHHSQRQGRDFSFMRTPRGPRSSGQDT